MGKYCVTILLIVNSLSVYCQNEYYKVEFDKFSPDAKQMAQMMEDNPADSFNGLAHNGEQISFEKWAGVPMVLWFWDINDEICRNQIDGLNLMHQIFDTKTHFVGFIYDKRSILEQFTAKRGIDFPVIPNSFRLGELNYGSEMGQGRLFLIDRNGIVRKAIPRDFFLDNNNSFIQLRGLIEELVNEED
ncbi:MAG: redoxin domain-containing protein [Saprospiraceae bacterium]